MPRTVTSDITSVVVGRAIRDARREVGLTQADLAARMGTSAPYVSLLETGKTNMTVGQLSAVAAALGTEMHIEFRVPAVRPEPIIPTLA